MAGILGTPYTPEPFQGIPKENGHGLSQATMAKIDKVLLGNMPPKRAERIAA
jgi:hypothetical protein